MALAEFNHRDPGRMPGSLFAPLVLSLLAAYLPHAVAADKPWPGVESGAIRAHVSFLADDLLEGRAPGTRGHELAARYVAAQMQLIGLEPAGTDRDWLQPLSLIESTSVLPAARAVIRRGAEVSDLTPGADFIPLPSFLAEQATVEAGMAFVGFGVSAPRLGYDDYHGIDLKGKVAVVLDGVPAGLPPDLHDYFGKQKAQQLAARGAVGMVLLTKPSDGTRESWTRQLARTRVGRMRLLGSDGRPVDAYAGLEASITLSVPATARLFAGEPKSIEQVWADAEAGRYQSAVMQSSIAMTTHSRLRTIPSANVVGVLRGVDADLRDEYVVLTAHLDHIGRSGAAGGDDIYNGALDNASGVAVMLEAARALMAMEPPPKRSILFVATTAEEPGLLGSRHFSLNPGTLGGPIVAALNLDMPVALYPAAGYTIIGAEHSTLGGAARAALEAEGLRALPNLSPGRGLFTYTDQYSFVREGVPALYLHDGPVSADPAIDAQKVFDDFLERNYHRVSDDLALPINWTTLASLANVYARLCRDIANAPDRPQWAPDDFFGQEFGDHGSGR
jgi:hypothetical protein